jgi:hypothetical protein
VFLWKRLPERLECADVFAQSPERFPLTGETWCRPLAFATAIRDVGGWAPEEWWWSIAHGVHEAICCGIIGGTAIALLSHYATVAIRMIQHRGNRRAWPALGNCIGDNILMEQYLLAACLQFHRRHPASPYHDLDVRDLFDSTDAAFNESAAAAVGYTRLIGAAKTNPTLMDRLAARVRRDAPKQYAQCVRLGRDSRPLL